MTGAELLAAEIGDPEATRTVIAIVALLCVMGIALIMLALWLRRVTRPDPELLAPLELMGERSWRRADPVGQRRRLDEVRPDGAKPLTRTAAPPKLDATFDEGPSAPGFEDLRSSASDEVEPSGGMAEAELPAPTPPGGIPTLDVLPVETADAAAATTAVDQGEALDATAEVAVADRTGDVSPSTGAHPVDVGVVDADDELAGGNADGADEGNTELDEGDEAPVDAASESGEGRQDSPTPMATNRPELDDLFADLADGDIDPEALARAQADLDAELRQGVQDT